MRLLSMIFLSLALTLSASFALADQWVNGYTRSDGTYVQGHYRSDSNGTVRDNFSYKGNTNPYTGEIGTNRYRDNPTSEYYNGGYNSRSGSSFGNSSGSGLNFDNNGTGLNYQNKNSYGWD